MYQFLFGFTEHLGPPPPYSQATEYLQKQKAEELAAQNQAKVCYLMSVFVHIYLSTLIIKKYNSFLGKSHGGSWKITYTG